MRGENTLILNDTEIKKAFNIYLADIFSYKGYNIKVKNWKTLSSNQHMGKRIKIDLIDKN